MAELNDIDTISFGGQSIGAAYIGGDMIWPSNYICELIPTFTMAGQYDIDHVPAGGGSASVSYSFVIKKSNGTVVSTTTVTPTVTLQEKINNQWTTAQNFRYQNSIWYANDRARNGLSGATGTATPSNAPARQSRITASYSTTYQGKAVSGTYTGVMTQNPNYFKLISSPYVNLQVSVTKYGASGSGASAAGATDAKVTATLDQQYNYRFYDGYTLVDGLAYQRTVSNAATSERFSFSVPSGVDWVTFPGTATSSGASVKILSRGTDYSTSERSATITATFTGSGATPSSGTVDIYQAKNDRTQDYSYTNLTLSSNPASPIPSTATSFQVNADLYYRWRYHYDSGSYGDWSQTETTSVIPTITAVKKDGATYTNYSGNTVTIAQNTGVSTITYKVTGRYTDPNGYTWSNKTLDVSQAYVPYSYKNTQVSVVYRVIGAAANVGHPRITVSQEVWQGGSRVDTISGSITDGTTGGTASGSTITGIAFAITRVVGSAVSGTGASFSTTNGDVTTASRRTTEGPQRDVATGVYISILINGVEATNTSSATAEQAANSKGSYIDPVYTLVSINSLSTYNISDTCLDTDVTATVKATWTEGGYKYSSYYDGDTTNGYTGLTQHSNQTVTGSSTPAVTMRVNGTSDFSNSQNKFTVNNKYNTSQASHSVVALFGTLQSYAVTVTQKADAKSDWQYENYAVTLSVGTGILASGGTCSLVATGTRTRYKTWTDGTRVDTENGVPFVPTSLTLENNPGTSIYWKTNETTNSTAGTRSATLNHRDMMKVVTTDSVTVKAMADTQYDTEAVSVSNYLTNETVEGSWGTTYYQDRDYAVKTFTISDYTSQATEAPFIGAETSYNVVGSHLHTPYHDRSVYKKYTSWTSATNDDDHREYYTTETEQYGASTEVTTDRVLVTSSESWVTVNTTRKKLIFAAQTSGSTPRYASITATNENGGTGLVIQVFQGGYASISCSPTDLLFPYSGGDSSFTVTWQYTTFTVVYSRPSLQEPLLTLSPLSGGSTTSTGSTIISVHCDQRDEGIEEGATGYIHIYPGNAALSDQTVRVLQ